MKLLTKQQALKAYLAGYTIVYNIDCKFKQVNQNTRLNASNEYYVLGYMTILLVKLCTGYWCRHTCVYLNTL